MSNTKVNSTIIKVNKLLCLPGLTIPNYQRPYRWAVKNVIQLLKDVQLHKNKSTYRLGTVVIHKEKNNACNIVDGQQRTVTLLLIAKAVLKKHTKKAFKHTSLKQILENLETSIFNPKFSHPESIYNIKNNFNEIERFISRMQEDELYYLFEKCEFIKFELTDISEAFQFFDSQNARGKDLEPHDLLKAYHLREFSLKEEKDQETIVNTWESMESEEIAVLFSEYLYRIKGWSKGNTSRYFTKEEIYLFKGININNIQNFPYAKIMRIAHFYVDDYNNNYHQNTDFNTINFPFQLDQTIINGKRFFEMVSHYKDVFDNFKNEIEKSGYIDEKAKRIMDKLDSYEGRFRTGDQYIRNLFNCAIIYYIDKFGYTEISQSIEKLFIWAYRLRLRHQAVYLASVDNYVIREYNIFKIMKDAIHPKEIISIHIPVMKNKAKSSKTEKIKTLFKELNYYEQGE